jgi:hypothetical protein
VLFGDGDQQRGFEPQVLGDGLMSAQCSDIRKSEYVPVEILPFPLTGGGVQSGGVDVPPLLFLVPTAAVSKFGLLAAAGLEGGVV